jgi:hypothetical protein
MQSAEAVGSIDRRIGYTEGLFTAANRLCGRRGIQGTEARGGGPAAADSVAKAHGLNVLSFSNGTSTSRLAPRVREARREADTHREAAGVERPCTGWPKV